MSIRPIKKQPFIAPKGVILPNCPALSLEDVYHTPGQAAAIRFFDVHSKEDFEAMAETLRAKKVKRWMDDAINLTKQEYEDWAGTHSVFQYLFAVLDARLTSTSEMMVARGFIYLYSERSEKFRVKRMEQQGFIDRCAGLRHSLEISFALRPPKVGQHAGSGLISSGIRQSCLQVKMLLQNTPNTEVLVFGCVDEENVDARRTLEAAGFEHKGLMKYDADSPQKSCLYILNWKTLNNKLTQKLLELA